MEKVPVCSKNPREALKDIAQSGVNERGEADATQIQISRQKELGW